MDISYYKKFEPIDGKWYLTKELGSGAFGTVFEVERKDFSDAKSAMKIISIPNSPNEVETFKEDNYDMDEASVTSYFYGFVEEFVKEFQLMSKLRGHSNIVSYEDHDVIQRKDEIGWDIFIRMELLTPMNKFFASKAPTQLDVINLGIGICKALELCQKYNIIHRDIKPSNIFVSQMGEYKLGDFGVARTLEKTSSGLSKKGTYTYMAPEVFKGEEYNATVDIYSLGIVMYKILNNNLEPFRTNRTHTDEENAMARRLRNDPIPKPCNADDNLASIVLKACSYNPKDRFSTPEEMRIALENIIPRGGVSGVAPVVPDVKSNVSDEEDQATVGVFGEKDDEKTVGVFSQVEEDEKTVGVFSQADDDEKTVGVFGNDDEKTVGVFGDADDEKTVGVFVDSSKIKPEKSTEKSSSLKDKPKKEKRKKEVSKKTSDEDKKKSKKGLIITLIALIIVICAAAGVYFSGLLSFDKKEKAKEESVAPVKTMEIEIADTTVDAVVEDIPGDKLSNSTVLVTADDYYNIPKTDIHSAKACYSKANDSFYIIINVFDSHRQTLQAYTDLGYGSKITFNDVTVDLLPFGMGTTDFGLTDEVIVEGCIQLYTEQTYTKDSLASVLEKMVYNDPNAPAQPTYTPKPSNGNTKPQPSVNPNPAPGPNSQQEPQNTTPTVADEPTETPPPAPPQTTTCYVCGGHHHPSVHNADDPVIDG